MKFNSIIKNIKLKLNTCNIVLIILILFVTLTYTSIVPHLTKILRLKKEEEIVEDFRRKNMKIGDCMKGKQPWDFNYVMGTHFGKNVTLKRRPIENRLYTKRGLPKKHHNKAGRILNRFSGKAKRQKYQPYISKKYFLKQNRSRKQREFLCRNYTEWDKDINKPYRYRYDNNELKKLPRRVRRQKDPKVGSENASVIMAFNKRPSVIKPCLYDTLIQPGRTRNKAQLAMRKLVRGDQNLALNACHEISMIRKHPLTNLYRKQYRNKRMRRTFNNMGWDRRRRELTPSRIFNR